ncbi:MAG: GNAT family N-acetyltransferase [Saprospiraceae bacterium]|nr:GNAT family N-acetyltransferase [Saprospiraceae bacterium]
MNTEYSFFQIDFGSPDYDEAVSLRNKVLRIPLGLEFTEEQLEEEWNQLHFVLRNSEDKTIACLIFKIENSDVLKMRQVAVDDSYQSKGCGSKLVIGSELWATANGYKKIELHARDKAVEFYNKLGYVTVGEEFIEVGIPHRSMEKIL